jgi:archaeal flagellar protein FlaJ
MRQPQRELKMFEDLKQNLGQEKKIIEDLNAIQQGLEGSREHKDFYSSSINSLLKQLRMLNRTVPDLLKEGSSLENGRLEKKKNILKMSYVSPSTKEKRYITINKQDKKEFLEKLKLSEGSISSIQKTNKQGGEVVISKPSELAKISNRFFRKYSENLVPKFGSLADDLKKANIHFLTSTYISIALFISSLAFLSGILLFSILMVFSLGSWVFFWIPFASGGFSLVAFYFYPSSEANSMQKKVSQELPFATIHMAAIAGSNIEPTKIFKIIATSKEYSNIGKEMRKIVNQTEVYGYDLVTALKNVAKRTSNRKLSELLGGLATNISTGGELKSYLEKKADNFLLDYKLERRKYSELAGTFMDIYISILIAAPLVLMMMFIIMGTMNLGFQGLSTGFLMIISIVAVMLANIIFLVILNFKQPKV